MRALRQLAALQANPHGPVQPASHPAQLGQQRLGEQQAFTKRRYGPEPQSAAFVAPVNHGSPAESRRGLLIPVDNPEQLFA